MRLPFIPSSWLAAFWRFYRRTEQAELDLISAGVAFYAFLALFPAAAAVITLWGFFADPEVIRAEVALLKPVLPPDVLELVQDQIAGLLAVTSSNIGLTAAISAVLAFWSARAGVAALIRGLNAIHHLPNRLGHWHQLRAMVLTLAMLGLALTAMLIAVVLPLILPILPLGDHTARVLTNTNLALSAALAVVGVGAAYHFGPNYPARRPPFFSVGLLMAVVLWLLVSRGLMAYLANFNSYNRIYGSIGAVAALLMWLYLSAYAVLLGAAVDAERNRRPKDQTCG